MNFVNFRIATFHTFNIHELWNYESNMNVHIYIEHKGVLFYMCRVQVVLSGSSEVIILMWSPFDRTVMQTSIDQIKINNISDKFKASYHHE